MHTHYSTTSNETLSTDTLVNDLDRNIHAKIVVLDFVVTREICASQTYSVLTHIVFRRRLSDHGQIFQMNLF